LPGLGEDAECGKGGGLGAQNISAERDGLPAGCGGETAFPAGPAAFGAGEDGDGVFGGAGGRESVEQEWGAGIFFEEETEAGGIGSREWSGGRDFGNPQTPGLLAAFAHDFPPSLDAFGGGGGQAFFGALGVDGNDAGNAKLGGFFDEPLEAVELDESGVQRDVREGRDGGDRLEDAKSYAGCCDGGDFGEISAVVVGELEALARLGTKDAGEMAGVITGELGAIVRNVIDEEAAAGQKTW